MNEAEIQRDIRSAIAVAYELSRHEHVQNREIVSVALRELEAELLRIEAELGGPRHDRVAPGALEAALTELGWVVDDAGPVVAAQIRALDESVRRIGERLAWLAPTRDVPARPLLGALPLRRAIPQDVSSALEYTIAFAAGSTVLFARTKQARMTGAVLEAMLTTGALVADVHLSAIKLVPIELHEVHDYLWGTAALVAPFALGYARRDKVAAAVHVAAGAALLLTAMLTDFRRATGKGHRRRAHR